MSRSPTPGTTFILDLTRGSQGARDTVAACRGLADAEWELLAIWSDAGGAEMADSLGRLDGRVNSRAVGSGAGVCDWVPAIREAAGQWVVFLRPGDVLRPDAMRVWRDGLASRDGAVWAIGAAPDAPNNDWWFQRDLADSAAALLMVGAAFPECTALVAREAWLAAVAGYPEIAHDPSRASAWIALALLQRPALQPEIVATAASRPPQLDADTLVRVFEARARRDPAAAARTVADVGRLASGMRVAHNILLEALACAERCFGRVPSAIVHPSDWLTRTRFFEGLLARGDRAVWIWGAGKLGLDALAWLQGRSVPVTGFIDKDARRAGTEWGGLTVRNVAPTIDSAPPSAILVVVASMYHAEISTELTARGWQEGVQFVIFQPEVSWAPGAVHS